MVTGKAVSQKTFSFTSWCCCLIVSILPLSMKGNTLPGGAPRFTSQPSSYVSPIAQNIQIPISEMSVQPKCVYVWQKIYTVVTSESIPEAQRCNVDIQSLALFYMINPLWFGISCDLIQLIHNVLVTALFVCLFVGWLAGWLAGRLVVRKTQ